MAACHPRGRARIRRGPDRCQRGGWDGDGAGGESRRGGNCCRRTPGDDPVRPGPGGPRSDWRVAASSGPFPCTADEADRRSN